MQVFLHQFDTVIKNSRIRLSIYALGRSVLTRHETVFRLKSINYKVSVGVLATAAASAASNVNSIRIKRFEILFQFNCMQLHFAHRFSRSIFSLFLIFVWHL